jgi:hypothetical protein
MNDTFTCSDIDDHARDLVRLERSADAGARARVAVATAHLATCPRCVRRMAAERALDAALAGLARADADAAAPPRVEAALRAHFPPRRRWVAPAGALATAAATVALWFTLRPSKVPVRVEIPPARTEVVTVAETDVEVYTPRTRAPFLPIGGVHRARDTSRGHVVRMQVPATLPVMFGWPLPPEDDRPRAADVLFGEDGVARAIRFVPTSFRAGR